MNDYFYYTNNDQVYDHSCERRGVVKRLFGHGYFKYSLISTLPMLVLPFQLKSSFKTFQDDGTVMFFQATTLNNIYVHTEIKVKSFCLLYKTFLFPKIITVSVIILYFMLKKARVSVYIKFCNILKVIKLHVVIPNFHESHYTNLKSNVYNLI